MNTPHQARRLATAAVAADASGRHIFLSTNRYDFFRVPILPMSIEEAASFEQSEPGAAVTYEQLIATYGGDVVLIPIGDGSRRGV